MLAAVDLFDLLSLAALFALAGLLAFVLRMVLSGGDGPVDSPNRRVRKYLEELPPSEPTEEEARRRLAALRLADPEVARLLEESGWARDEKENRSRRA